MFLRVLVNSPIKKLQEPLSETAIHVTCVTKKTLSDISNYVVGPDPKQNKHHDPVQNMYITNTWRTEIHMMLWRYDSQSHH